MNTEAQIQNAFALITTRRDNGTFKTIREIEKEYIVLLFNTIGNDKTKVAGALGVSVKTLYNKIDEYGMYSDYVFVEELACMRCRARTTSSCTCLPQASNE